MAASDANENMDVGTRYEFVKALGRGSYGVALLMKERGTNEYVACKYIPRGDQVDKNVEREIQNHQRLSAHSKIVKFKEVFLTSTHVGIAMEYASGGTLFDRVVKITRFKEEVARYFFQQLVCAVAWCHSQGVCHRDIKLENTLLDGRSLPRVKLCDFGYSKSRLLESAPKTTVGTPAYVAPEVLSKGAYDGEKADVWSCGVALYTMLVGAYPFQDPKDPSSCRATVQRILAVQYVIPSQLKLSEACVDLISRIFVPDPARRLSLQQIREHPWFLINLQPDCQSLTAALSHEPPQQSEAEIAAILRAAHEPPELPDPIKYGTAGGQGEELGLSGEIRMEEQLIDMMDDDSYRFEA